MNEKSEQFPRRRPVRSFVLRGGRLTGAQQRALATLWPHYGIDPGDDLLDLNGLFGRSAPVVVEIGFGDGEATWRMAAAAPGENFVAVEVHKPGVGRLLIELSVQGVSNTKVYCGDAVEFLERRIPLLSLSGVRLFFPDPWPKKRHHKRRIVHQSFLDTLSARMKEDAILHLATDWQPYAERMLKLLSDRADFENLATSGDYCLRPDWRPQTKYEKRGQRLGHEVFDLLFRRTAK